MIKRYLLPTQWCQVYQWKQKRSISDKNGGTIVGQNMPMLGLGTWKSPPEEVKKAIYFAIQTGYRHIDCAFVYKNEKEIGQALRQSFNDFKLKRSDIWITSKLWNTCHRPEHVKSACEITLRDLGLDYLDLYLIHWPIAFQYHPTDTHPKDDSGKIKLDYVPLADTWKAMEELVKLRLVKSIGVSNFLEEHIKEVQKVAKIKPAVNQIEVHPYLPQKKLLQFCKENNIHITAYSPLATASNKTETESILENKVVVNIADKRKKTAAQIILRWGIQRGTSVIPKSITPARIKENFEVFDFELTNEEMKKLDTLDKGLKFVTPVWFKDQFEPV